MVHLLNSSILPVWSGRTASRSVDGDGAARSRFSSHKRVRWMVADGGCGVWVDQVVIKVPYDMVRVDGAWPVAGSLPWLGVRIVSGAGG
jgi:hypothetical protein